MDHASDLFGAQQTCPAAIHFIDRDQRIDGRNDTVSIDILREFRVVPDRGRLLELKCFLRQQYGFLRIGVIKISVIVNSQHDAETGHGVRVVDQGHAASH